VNLDGICVIEFYILHKIITFYLGNKRVLNQKDHFVPLYLLHKKTSRFQRQILHKGKFPLVAHLNILHHGQPESVISYINPMFPHLVGVSVGVLLLHIEHNCLA
jgi:hypothetical protein